MRLVIELSLMPHAEEGAPLARPSRRTSKRPLRAGQVRTAGSDAPSLYPACFIRKALAAGWTGCLGKSQASASIFAARCLPSPAPTGSSLPAGNCY